MSLYDPLARPPDFPRKPVLAQTCWPDARCLDPRIPTGATRQDLCLHVSGGRRRSAAAISDLSDLITVSEHVIRRGFNFARRNHLAIRLVMREVVDHGEVSAERRARFVDPFFERITQAMGEMLGRGKIEIRLMCQSAVNLVVRYALSSEHELEIVTGLPGLQALDAVETHLVKAVSKILEIEEK